MTYDDGEGHNAAAYCEVYYPADGETETVSEADYRKAMEEYGESAVVNFGYGASDNPH